MKRAAAAFLVFATFFGGAAPVGALTNAPMVHVRQGASTNWSGYAIETNLSSPTAGVMTDVKAQWVVPQVTCSGSNTYSSTWVGIDGYFGSSTVEQIGTEQDCSAGSGRYYAWYEMYPKLPATLSLAVHPNDTISAEVAYVGSANFQLTLTNVTTGKSFSTQQKSARAQRVSAEWIVEAPSSGGGPLPLANFGTAQFSNASATVKGVTGTISNGAWQNDAITMVTSSGTVKAQPAALSPDGSSFSDTWQHS
jgi:hypothetical protein